MVHRARGAAAALARAGLALAGLAAFHAGVAAAGPAAAAGGLRLHVPSPDWRDQVIYFVLTDRFADGNPANNDQGVGAYDPTRPDKVNGGDLAGLVQRLGYIQGLGATALWITPPVLNQWHDPLLGYWSYHGYWAQDFTRVDPHVGTLADYRRLSDALHRRGLYLVQDIVVNHVGNYFDYGPDWSPADPARGYIANPGSRPTARPTQPPFHLNDPRDPKQRAAGIYHWTPSIRDVTVREQELAFQTSGLDDLNTENPVVRRALRASFGHWIRAVGVDAFRVDTAYHVPPEFFTDFLHARDPKAPGIAEVARRTGRRDFLVFGEGFGIDKPGEQRFAKKLEAYVRAEDGRRRMHGMLNFPLYAGLVDTFARGLPPSELAGRIGAMVEAGTRGVSPHLLPSFVDNHDVDRFLAGGSEAALRQALLAMMTLPGIPVLYYGTEQGFTLQRPAMFAAGWGSGGRDRYDTTAPLYRYTAAVTQLRRAHRVFTRGTPRVVHASDAGPGAIAWRSDHEGTDGKHSAIVAFNTADEPRLLDNLDVGAGARLVALFDLHAQAEGRTGTDVQAGPDGRVHLVLPARSGRVWRLEGVPGAPGAPGATRATAGGPAAGPRPTTTTAATAAPAPEAAPTLDPLPATPLTGDTELRGRAAPGQRVQLVVDGDLSRAPVAVAGPDGRFAARLDTRRLHDAGRRHRVVAWEPATGRASAPLEFRAELPWRVLAEVTDPAGDDRGLPGADGQPGRYRYPTHESFAPGQMDIRRVRASQAGGALRLEVEMGALSRVWGAPNGFDHVAFTIFVELPGAPGGARVMPDQDGSLPEGLVWHRRLRAHGWSNALFGAEGAGPAADGTPVAPVATIDSDAGRRTVTFTIPSAALGDPASLSGARVWVTTWDYDGGYRALAREPAAFTFGGGEPGRDPKVIDASAVITLP